MDTLEFLDLVWEEKDCYVDLPSKAHGHWIPANLEWPADRDIVERRIESCLEDDEDVYFSVARFRSKGRRISDVLPTRWLWADLDRVDPVFLGEDGVHPSVAWESSRGRYQALWRLAHSLAQEQHSALNRALSLAIGADAGGWDATQVLRPPGTVNFKYLNEDDGLPGYNVELLWYDPTVVYEPVEIARSVKAIRKEEHAPTARAAFDKAVAKIVSLDKLPARARRLLNTPEDQVVVGERSAQLWQLECLLLERGLSEQQVFDLVVATHWNKHKEVRDGDKRLVAEIAKAASSVRNRASAKGTSGSDGKSSVRSTVSTGDDVRDLREGRQGGGETADEPAVESMARRNERASPFVEYSNFLSATIETPRWLIQDIWSSASHGIIGGEPKTSKSLFAMSMAMSVASGRPFLGKYSVTSPGPVLMIQEENAPWVVQDRLRKIAYSYGLIRDSEIEVTKAQKGSVAAQSVRLDFPDEVPLRMLNNYGFDLTDEEDRELLEREIRVVGPVMLVLDPLYSMAVGINLSASQDIMPIMQWLMAIRYNYDCAVVLVHHWSKGGAGTAQEHRRAGQKLMGSGLLHGWTESAVYIEQLPLSDEGRFMCRAEREFRNFMNPPALEIGWLIGEPGTLDLDIEVTEQSGSGLQDAVLDAVREEPGISLNTLTKDLGAERKHVYSAAVSGNVEMQEIQRGYGISYKLFPPGYEMSNNGK